MARGNSSVVSDETSAILYGRVSARNNQPEWLSERVNARTQQEIGALSVIKDPEDLAPVLKVLNNHRQQWAKTEGPALNQLAAALGTYMMHTRGYDLPRSEQEIMTHMAAAALKHLAASQRITTRDIRELCFEAQILLVPISNNREVAAQILEKLMERSENALRHNREDKWLEQGFLPLASAALRLNKYPDLSFAVDSISRIALQGRHKAMKDWSQGCRGWISSETYIDRFFMALHRMHPHKIELEDQRRRIITKLSEKQMSEVLEQGLIAGEIKTMFDVAKLSQKSLAAACCEVAAEEIRSTPGDLLSVFRASGLLSNDRLLSNELKTKIDDAYPEDAVTAALAAYHQTREETQGRYLQPQLRMSTAFVKALGY